MDLRRVAVGPRGAGRGQRPSGGAPPRPGLHAVRVHARERLVRHRHRARGSRQPVVAPDRPPGEGPLRHRALRRRPGLLPRRGTRPGGGGPGARHHRAIRHPPSGPGLRPGGPAGDRRIQPPLLPHRRPPGPVPLLRSPLHRGRAEGVPVRAGAQGGRAPLHHHRLRPGPGGGAGGHGVRPHQRGGGLVRHEGGSGLHAGLPRLGARRRAGGGGLHVLPESSPRRPGKPGRPGRPLRRLRRRREVQPDLPRPEGPLPTPHGTPGSRSSAGDRPRIRRHRPPGAGRHGVHRPPPPLQHQQRHPRPQPHRPGGGGPSPDPHGSLQADRGLAGGGDLLRAAAHRDVHGERPLVRPAGPGRRDPGHVHRPHDGGRDGRGVHPVAAGRGSRGLPRPGDRGRPHPPGVGWPGPGHAQALRRRGGGVPPPGYPCHGGPGSPHHPPPLRGSDRGGLHHPGRAGDTEHRVRRPNPASTLPAPHAIPRHRRRRRWPRDAGRLAGSSTRRRGPWGWGWDGGWRR